LAVRRVFKLGLALATAALFLCSPAFAQMKSGEAMKNYEQVFGVKNNQPTYPYDITLMDSTPAGNVLAPGQQPTFTFLLRNNLSLAIHEPGQFHVISYGTRGIPGDVWTPELFKIADLPDIPIQVNVAAHGSQVITVKPELPEALGGYAFVADLGPQGRRFATSCARTFAPAPEKIQYPKMSLDDSVGVPVLKALGVRAIRMSVGYIPTTSPQFAPAMEKLNATLDELAANNITVMLMFLTGPDAPQPLGRGRPHLDANGVMLDTKQDLAWLPQNDPDFQKFVSGLCQKQGWPRGPVTAVELWNEPWDGISISGWGADEPRFLELYTAMAHGVEEARAAGAQVLLAGCDSSTNTMDKLFADGSDTFLPWLDVCTIHYQGICAPVLFKKWINRQGPNGRVKIWDTESWVANTDDRVATIVAGDRAAGYDRSMGVYSGNISTENQETVVLPDGSKKPIDTFHAWSTAAAVGAAQHFIGERNFHEFLFKNGLPWVMEFDGLKGNPDDGTVVIVGDLNEAFGANIMLFHGVRGLAELKQDDALRPQLAALPADSPERAELEQELNTPGLLNGTSLVLQNPHDQFVLYDFYGNPVASPDHTITVPLDQRGFFLRTNGTPGSFAQLTQAVAQARIDGYEPLNIVAHDMLTPVDQHAALHLSLTNILNRPISGTASITLGQLKLDVPPKLDFQPHETKEVEIPITGGSPSPDNIYPLAFKFDAGADGFAEHQENLHVNVIAKRTITVDGNLEDWKGVLPEIVTATGNQGPSLMEAEWLPFNKFKTSQGPGLATGYLAYDDTYFYFAAKIAESAPPPGTLRYEKRNDDDYFYPQTSYAYDPVKTLLKKDETWHEPLREKAALLLPQSTSERSFTAWSSVSKAFAVDLDLTADSYKQVAFYFVDWDPYKMGRRFVTIDVQDAATGKSLAHTAISQYGAGAYVKLLLAGKVRVIFRGQTFLSASLSGIFFDSVTTEKTPQSQASAVIEGPDIETGGNWQPTYGHDGYNVIGAPAAYPSYAKVTVPEIVEKTEYQWPDGVRRYSYRKQPDLPFGSNPNKFANVQIAFNVIPEDEKSDMIPFPPGTMPDFVPHSDTDYEYALNKVADAYGGGTEIWRCLVPGMPRKSFFPRQLASPFDGPVNNGKLVVRDEDNTRIVEAALPWTEIPLVKKAMESGQTIKFSFRINDDSGPAMELAEERSVSKKNPYTFHPDWTEHWSNEVEFSFEK
jgi:hypothetical protein